MKIQCLDADGVITIQTKLVITKGSFFSFFQFLTADIYSVIL